MDKIMKNVKFNEKGLIPAILQDSNTKEVLMAAYMNQESLEMTLRSGKATFWSRSRQELWVKGETSGNYQLVEEIRIDCDNDTILVMVKPLGPACHTGKKSCFYRKLDGQILDNKEDGDSYNYFLEKAVFLKKLYQLIKERKDKPIEGSYTNYLFNEGVDKVCKKVGEEAAEVIIGAKNADHDEIVYEVSDLIYHLLVLLNIYQIPLEDILIELEGRSK
nr:bifunctional phosphoribosyl-AMP cyclohydrolase/phosphoribosyl-ATP diphosphatase HisIE [Halocella sp. SP3-1]